jgi:hypothetical protein
MPAMALVDDRQALDYRQRIGVLRAQYLFPSFQGPSV